MPASRGYDAVIIGGGHNGLVCACCLAGAGAHPGGGVTGLPGHNAVREILRDLKARRRKRRAG